MGKVLYTLVVVLITAWSVFFISNYYHNKAGNQVTSGLVETTDENGNTQIVQEVVEREVITQEDARIEAINKVSPAIVGVVNFARNTTQGEGSGIVYKKDGNDTYIVTNQHVVDGGDYFEVVFSNSERSEATLVGSDIYTDLAVLKVSGIEVEAVAEFGNTEDLKIGQTVIAIGNPLGLDFAGSATSGIVSGTDRVISVDLNGDNYDDWEMTVLQTDTAINPGNSGGALINLDGKVVGINSMKIATSSVEGMSFSIPTYVATPIINDLETYGEVRRPQLGVYIQEMSMIPDRLKEILNIPTDQKTGVFIYEVFEGGLAEKMGLKAGDIITAVNGEEVEDTMAFRKKLYSMREGDQLELTIIQDGETKTLSETIQPADGTNL
ncbi:MAG: trypsin-like peptidase domain-containing protein [Turicibacter sp.]|nr:trypsin-like peptidase domain-containing protein [Turicibacter sp.]